MFNIENFEKELCMMCKRVLPMHEVEVLNTIKGKSIIFKSSNKSDNHTYPIYYIEDLYHEYLKTENMINIVQDILCSLNSNENQDSIYYITEIFKHINNHKDSIYPILCNVEMYNKLYNKHLVYINWTKDTVITFGIIYKNSVIRITNDILNELKEKLCLNDLDELKTLAFKNLYNEKTYIKSMNNLLVDIFNDDDLFDFRKEYSNDISLRLNELYILRLSNNIIGASILLNESILNEIAHNYNGDFVILPSSLEEILITKPKVIDKEFLNDCDEMIKEVNESEVEDKIKLSDFILIYNKEKNKIMEKEEYINYI